MKRKRKGPIPIMLLWSKKEQLRFSDAVEKLVSACRDLVGLVEQLQAERLAGQRKYERRKQAREVGVVVNADGTLPRPEGLNGEEVKP